MGWVLYTADTPPSGNDQEHQFSSGENNILFFYLILRRNCFRKIYTSDGHERGGGNYPNPPLQPTTKLISVPLNSAKTYSDYI